MYIEDEARAIRKLNRRLVKLHRKAWERWQAAASTVPFPADKTGPRKPRLVGPLRSARLSRNKRNPA